MGGKTSEMEFVAGHTLNTQSSPLLPNLSATKNLAFPDSLIIKDEHVA